MDTTPRLIYAGDMATSLSIVGRDSTQELRAFLARTRDEGHRKRIRAIIRIKEGELHGVVARALGASRTSVCDWITKYNKSGAAALATDKGGRPEGNPLWDTSVFEGLAKEIDTGGYWSVPRMQRWISEHHRKDIPEQTVWYRMDKLGYSYKGARPHPAHGNKTKQDAFKKGASFRSWSH